MSGQQPSPATLPLRKERLVSEPSLFWDVTRPRLVDGYRSFGKLIGPTIYEGGTDRLSRNVCNQPPNYAAAEDWKLATLGTSGKVKILPLSLMELRFARRSAHGTVIVLSEVHRFMKEGCKSNYIYFRKFYFFFPFNIGFIAKIM
jgi:hypothetical protein